MALALMGLGHAASNPDPAPPKKLDLPPIAVPIIQNFTLMGYYAFNVHITHTQSAPPETMKAAVPTLTDTIITTAYKASYALWTPDLPLDQALLESLIQLELGKLKLPPGFEGLTMTEFRALDPQGRDSNSQQRTPHPARGTDHAPTTP